MSASPLSLSRTTTQLTRYIFKETLAHEGFAVLEAGDGREALDLCDACCPDLVLLDVEMPSLDGYSTCREIRTNDAHRQMPVVMVTSHDDRRSIDRAFESGATDFIAKPISWPLLAHRLRYVLRGADNLKALGRNARRKPRAHGRAAGSHLRARREGHCARAPAR